VSHSALSAAAGDCLFVGIGVSVYDDQQWQPLEGVAQGVVKLAARLEQQGYLTYLLQSPKRQEIVDVLESRATLKEAGFKGPIVLVWSGHGDLVNETLALITRDTPSGAGKEDSAYRPDGLVAFLAESGSVDSLVIIDACWAGAGSTALLKRHIQELERRTLAGQEPAYAGIVSARGYERARDGAFLTELLELLENGPADVEPGLYDVHWSSHSASVPVGALLDTIARKRRGREQHPRTWLFGSSKIKFPNPRFDPEAPAQLVDDQARLARGEVALGEELVETPASAALIGRLAEGHPGLWLVTGAAGTGKSSCLAYAAARAPRPAVSLQAVSGIRELAAATAEAKGGRPILLDALDEAPPRERPGIIDLAYGWSRTRFVAVARRTPTDADATGSFAGAEQVIDVGAPEWQGDAIERYVLERLEHADGAH